MVGIVDRVRYLVCHTEISKGKHCCRSFGYLSVSDDRPIDDDFPDEQFVSMTSIIGWLLYFDGATNQLGFGIGILLISPQGDHIPRSVRLVFFNNHRLMNNIIEYEACITGLETALDLGIKQLEIMREVHARVCSPHMEGHMLARKITRTDYFWLTMEIDYCQFV